RNVTGVQTCALPISRSSLQTQILPYIFRVGPVDLIDDFLRDLFLWNSNHELQIQVSGRALTVSGNPFASNAELLAALRPRGNVYLHSSDRRRHFHGGPADGLADGDRQFHG